jgi:hypothetical protein
MAYESQNLPALQDVPMCDNYELQEYLITIKELIETMLGRRGNQPLTPQFQIGKYTGNGKKVARLIETNFRPKYVKVFNDPQWNPTLEVTYERLDDNEQGIDWVGYSYVHSDSGNYHDFNEASGISAISDDGFYVWAGTAGTAPINSEDIIYNWIAFG